MRLRAWGAEGGFTRIRSCLAWLQLLKRCFSLVRLRSEWMTQTPRVMPKSPREYVAGLAALYEMSETPSRGPARTSFCDTHSDEKPHRKSKAWYV